jgi:hypothetical protein
MPSLLLSLAECKVLLNGKALKWLFCRRAVMVLQVRTRICGAGSSVATKSWRLEADLVKGVEINTNLALRAFGEHFTRGCTRAYGTWRPQ